MTRLLDVNVLVALAWPNHVHHGLAHRWFRARRRDGWATCPLTESGFVRVSSNRRAIPGASTPAEAVALLRRMRRLGGHVFWADDVSPAEPSATPFARVAGHRQVTDAHLLALALRRGGVLATLDRGLAELAGPSERDSVEVIRFEVRPGD